LRFYFNFTPFLLLVTVVLSLLLCFLLGLMLLLLLLLYSVFFLVRRQPTAATTLQTVRFLTGYFCDPLVHGVDLRGLSIVIWFVGDRGPYYVYESA
jgi:hypothetical protein